MTLLQFLSNPIVALAVGLIASWFFYFRQKHLKRLSYEAADNVVVAPDIKGGQGLLEVRFGGIVVPQVTRSTIRIWNSGRETIHGSDVASADPLRWKLPASGDVLSATFERVAREPNQMSLSIEPGAVLITFDFLDRGDGANINVLHSGAVDQSSLQGTIKGIGKGPSNWTTTRDLVIGRRPRMSLVQVVANFVTGTFFLFMTAFGTFTLLSGLAPDYFIQAMPLLAEDDGFLGMSPGSRNLARIAVGLFGLLLFGALSTIMTMSILRRPPKSLL